MAVFTPVSSAQAQTFLTGYGEGALETLEPIAEGVENTNYRLTTTKGTVLVLTLFEKRIRREDLPFCLGLTEHLAARGFATPTPVRDRTDALVGELNGRPAALVRWAEGAWPRQPSAAQAEVAGEVLADLHLKGRGFQLRRDNPVGPDCWRQLAERCATVASGEHAAMLAVFTEELAWLDRRLPQDLPSGPIHADYFPDNVLFEGDEGGGDRVGGVIDFYFACTGPFAYDLAVALNAWAFTRPGAFRPDIAEAFTAGYAARRRLTAAERAALLVLCRAAAVRFGLTRLHDLLYHPADAVVTPKDPRDYLARLQFFRRPDAAEALEACPAPHLAQA